MLARILKCKLDVRHDGVVAVPFVSERDRCTVDDVHWVGTGDMMNPIVQTDLGQDSASGYCHGNFRSRWRRRPTARCRPTL